MAYPRGGMAVKDLSFRVAKGEFVFLTGHSGAGKSTILKLISADLRPTHGELRVSGFSIGELTAREVPKLRRRLGIVFQDFRLLQDRTAEENVAFALEVTGARPDTIPTRVHRVLTQVGLASRARAYPTELSGGEQQRVGIARALVNDPPILLADEPTGNLDSTTSEEIMRVFAALHAEGQTVVMVTHEPDIAAHAARVVILRDGRVASDVLNQPRAA